MTTATDEFERFWRHVAPPAEPGGCLLWTGAINGWGYATFLVGRSARAAHRFLYERIHGPLPPGLVLDHLCRVRHCVAPDHLEPVTNRENVLRGVGATAQHARQTHCKNGHPLVAENLKKNSRERQCRTCANAASRRLYWRRRALKLGVGP